MTDDYGAPCVASSDAQYSVPSARVAIWYPERQVMTSDVRAPGGTGCGTVGDSPHAASPSVAPTARSRRRRMTTPWVRQTCQT